MAIVAVGNFLITLGTLLYAHSVKRSQATHDQIAKVETKVADEIKVQGIRTERHAERIQRLETRVDGVPTSEAIHELAISVERSNGDLRAVTARLDGWEGAFKRVENMINRQEEFLLQLGRGK